MLEKEYIGLIIKKIEDSLQWKPSDQWAEYDYKKLSDLIFQKTNTLISPLTMKRIFRSVPGTYNPKHGTKNALAQFVGYTDWQDFTEKEHVSISQTAVSSESNPVVNEDEEDILAEKKADNTIVQMLITAAILIGFGLLLYLLWHGVNGKDELNRIELSSDIIYGELPFTATIHYDITGVKDEEVYLNYNYNFSDVKKPLDRNKHEIHISFELPGSYTIAMRTATRVIKQTYITGISRGWYAYYFSKGNFGACKKEYLSPLDTFLYDTIHDGYLYFSPEEMKNFGANITKPYFLNNSIYSDFGVNGNNCSMEIRFRNALKEGGISCQACQFHLVGDTGWIHFSLTNPKSYSYTFVNLSGEGYSGETSDFKALGVNMNEWGVIKMISKNKRMSLIYNNDTIFNTPNNRPVENVRQISVISQGTAKIDYVRLFNRSDSIVYCEEFD